MFPFASPSGHFKFSAPPTNDLADRLKNLQSDLSTTEEESDRPSSSRPIKQIKRSTYKTTRPTFTTHQLPSFAAPPKEKPALTTQRPLVIDLPPKQEQQENEPVQQSAQDIADKVANCMDFVDDGQDHLATFMYELEALTPIHQWSQLRRLNLSKQNLTSLDDLSSCFPMLETLQV